MNSLIVDLYSETANPIFNKFAEALIDMELCYRASSLKDVFETSYDISHALQSAMSVCLQAGIPLRKHFSIIYVADNQVLSTDWKLSRFAFCLVLLNGDTARPMVGRMQLELLRHLL